jgi:hypothetical protein
MASGRRERTLQSRVLNVRYIMSSSLGPKIVARKRTREGDGERQRETERDELIQ